MSLHIQLRNLAAVAGLFLLGVVAGSLLLFRRHPPVLPPGPMEPPEVSWAEIEARVRPAVARVESRYRLTAASGEAVLGTACGSGVLVEPTLVLTSAHLAWPWRDALARPWEDQAGKVGLAASLDSLSVALPGQEPIPATLYAVAGEADLALLQISPRPTAISGLAAEAAAPEIAEEVGFFLHLPPTAEAPRPSLSGREPGLPRRQGPERRFGAAGDPLFFKALVAGIERDKAGAPLRIQLDRALNRCGGGAPLVNRRGDLVGLTEGYLAATGELTLLGKKREVESYAVGPMTAVSGERIRRFLTPFGLSPAVASGL